VVTGALLATAATCVVYLVLSPVFPLG